MPSKRYVMEVLTRKYYADIVDSWIGKGNIIAVVGARRVGKSYVVKDFIQAADNRGGLLSAS